MIEGMTLRERLEMAEEDYHTAPQHRAVDIWGDPYWYTAGTAQIAPRWNLFPEALQAYIDYQSRDRWHKAFVRGVV